MTTAKESIQDAYSGTLKLLFEQLIAAFAAAGSDATLKKQAEERFSAGVALAIAVRDRALALLPPSA